jgi:hypothetical protein
MDGPRDVEIVDDAEVDAGVVVARTRTWNVLHAIRLKCPVPELDAPGRVAVAELWKWNGEPWGGRAPDENDRSHATQGDTYNDVKSVGAPPGWHARAMRRALVVALIGACGNPNPPATPATARGATPGRETDDVASSYELNFAADRGIAECFGAT